MYLLGTRNNSKTTTVKEMEGHTSTEILLSKSKFEWFHQPLQLFRRILPPPRAELQAFFVCKNSAINFATFEAPFNSM